jgi:hypothetical protein
MKQKVKGIAAALLLSLVAVGCGGDSRKPTYPARGQVVLNGKPVPHALVVFHPVGPAEPDAPRPHATADANGNFEVGTYAGKDGAPAGEYRVTVEQWLSKAGRGEPVDAPAVNRLSPRYSRAELSGIKVEIKTGENELPPIKLQRS